ncbi:MAG: TonB-dependent receptor [Pseudomonadota bacterium]|nr:TonB-dependent receptor [Pseudomonadota bacterium]
MKKATHLRLSAGSFAVGLALAATPAFAQDTETEETAAIDGEAIIVTGSRVTDPNLRLSTPVAAIGEEELTLRQTNVAEQFLRELPGAVPSVGSAVNNGNGGASFVNLRGIGSVRNLVLLDGRRFVPADETGRVDLNNIPLAVIERTDILTGGATTTYGADAVSGVVNFITKRDFAGVELNATSTITEEGDGEIYRTELTVGGNFDDGRGNAVLSIGYQDQSAVFQGDRDFSLFNVSSFSGNAGGSSNSVPANIVFTGPVDPATGEPFGTVIGQINEAGTDISPGVNSAAGPFNFNPFNIFQTPFERFNVYGSANYEISDNVEVYSQAVFSKQTVSTIIAPGGSFFNTYQLNLNNPFIPDAIAQRFGDALGLSDAEFTAARNTQFGATLADGSANPDYVQFGTQVRRRTIEAGTRNSDFTTTLFNLVVGARGNITDSIEYDISATYGESERIQRQSGFARFARLQQSLLAIPDGAGGVQCADTSGGCEAINLFGLAGDLGGQAAQDYVFSLTQQVIDQSSIGTVQGAIFGDLPISLFDASPVNFAVGAEYREFSTGQVSDEASQTPGAVVGGGGADPNFTGSYDVFDVFGELVIPILEGVTFAENLTLELGGRYSNYELSSNEFTWKVGATWEPVDGFAIRGNFQKAARAPNIGELFFPVTTGLSNLQIDRCAGAAPTQDAALAAVCIAQGAPAAVVNSGGILPPPAGQVNATSGGNLQLDTEKAETWTLGFIAQPAAIPGLSLTVDYWNISIEDTIGSATIGDINTGCYDGVLDFNANPFCQLIERSATTGGLAGAPNEVRGFLQNLTNLGAIQTDGIDVQIRYGTDLTDDIGLTLSFDGTWTNENRFQAIAGESVNRDCVGFYSVNCGSIQPEFIFNQRTTLSFMEDYSLSLRWRYLSGVEQEPLDIADQGAAFVGNSSVFGEVDFTQIPAESYFDLSFQWDVIENVLFTFTVQNLFDNQPSVVGSNIGTTAFNSGNIYPSTYDPLGRRYSANLRLSF